VQATDVHQHLWPDELVDRLRARTRPPLLRGWTLHTDGEPPYDVDPAGHDVATRIAADRDAGVGSACLSLSAPLGVESLLRPAFPQDEWILIAVGAALGFPVGELQVFLMLHH